MIESPKSVLAAVKLEENYRALLRRVAAHPPFRHVTDEIRESSFLLAYSASEANTTSEKTTFELAKAVDIFVIDNSFFGRMFPVKRAPHESDLEDFYALIGANYISEVVEKKFDIIGPYERGTSVTKTIMERIQERSPLLLSSSNSSRSMLVDDAATILEHTNLEIVEAVDLKAIYSIGKSIRSQTTTCCYQQDMFGKKALLVTMKFDWFDVGFAIGELILKRCQLEDAFLISSLLEAPLDQLRARGFPVDRIIKSPGWEPTLTSNRFPSKSETPIFSDSDAKSRLEEEIEVVEKECKSILEREAHGDGKNNHDHATVQSKVSKHVHDPMLKRMNPEADESYLRRKPGNDPNINKVRSDAEEIALQKYLKDEAVSQTIDTSKNEEQQPSKLLGSKKLGKALKRFGGLPNHFKLSETQTQTGSTRGKGCSVSPKDDAILHSNMEKMLEKKIQDSQSVDSRGVKSQEQSISIPEGLDHGSTCEIVPSQDIAPFVGQNGKSQSHNGIKLFYFRKDQSSKNFMHLNYDAVECFAVVLGRLTTVFGLPLTSVAIYHDQTGRAIAFNSGGALYFNIRYFHGLHYSNNIHMHRVCYSYWYVVACHELAHNMEGPHTRTHAFYTESYTALYLPKLMAIFER